MLKMVIILAVSAVSGVLLLFAVYLLPTNEMKENVRRSSALFDYEGIHPQVVTGYKSTQLDNYTDTVMLAGAIYPGSGNLFSDAMMVPRIEYEGMLMPLSLTSYANDVKGETFINTYPRYWHGYLVFLKPLLLLFDFGDIRVLNMICQLFLNLMIIALIWEKAGKKHTLAFVMSIIVINPVATALSLQFTTVFYITMLTMLLIWKQPAVLRGKKRFYYYLLLFFTVGIITSYFDFLTYPILTLGLPLASVFVLEEKMTDVLSWKQQLVTTVGIAAVWGCGYIGMWAAKSVLGGMVTGVNVLADALARTSLYMGIVESDEPVYFMEVIRRSLGVLMKWPYVCGGGAVFICFLTENIRKGRQIVRRRQVVIPYFLIMGLPLAHILMKEHVFRHYWFTYRELAGTVFAGYCLLAIITEKIGESLQNSNRSMNFLIFNKKGK